MKLELEEDDELCDLLEALLVDAVLCVQTGFSTIGEELVEVVDVETLVDVDENRVVDVLTTDVEVLTKDVLVDLQKDEIYFFCQKIRIFHVLKIFPVVLVEITGVESLILVVLVLIAVVLVEAGVEEVLIGSTGFLSDVELQHMPRNSLLKLPKKLLLLSRFLFFFSFGHLSGSSLVLCLEELEFTSYLGIVLVCCYFLGFN